MPHHQEQIAAMIRAGDVKRYHALFTVQEQTVAAHSWRVAVLVRVLLEHDCNERVLWAALTHDFGEYITGDMPADIKMKLGVGLKMEEMENQVLRTLSLDDPRGLELTPLEKKALRVADCIDGLLFCNRELSLGNLSIVHVKERYMMYLQDIIQGAPHHWHAIINQLRYGNPA